MDRKTLKRVSFILVIIGGINWGLIGLLKINLAITIFGGTGLEDFVYVLIGASAVYLALNYSKQK